MVFNFQVVRKDASSDARLGILTTSHARIPTPAFMPVGTRGVVKTVSPEEVWDLGFRIILANAYHLYLRPGHELVTVAADDVISRRPPDDPERQ